MSFALTVRVAGKSVKKEKGKIENKVNYIQSMIRNDGNNKMYHQNNRVRQYQKNKTKMKRVIGVIPR
jgi:hypothetical protein